MEFRWFLVHIVKYNLNIGPSMSLSTEMYCYV
jgi:hypothetical protein